MTDEERQDLLDSQLAMTKATWERLAAHGVTESAELALDFSYRVPCYERANEFKRFLEDETDYTVHVVAVEERWRVSGTTRPTKVTLAILEEWVDWMVDAGSRFDCSFDGWVPRCHKWKGRGCWRSWPRAPIARSTRGRAVSGVEKLAYGPQSNA